MTDVGEKLTVSSVRINLHDDHCACHDFLNNCDDGIVAIVVNSIPLRSASLVFTKGISGNHQYSLVAKRFLRMVGKGPAGKQTVLEVKCVPSRKSTQGARRWVVIRVTTSTSAVRRLLIQPRAKCHDSIGDVAIAPPQKCSLSTNLKFDRC